MLLIYLISIILTIHFTKSLDEPVEVNTVQRKLHGVGVTRIHITVEGQDSECIKVTMEGVLCIPGMDSNLLSSNVLLKKGLEIRMHPMKGTNILLYGKIVVTTIPHGKLLHLKIVHDEVKEHRFKMVVRKPAASAQPKPLLYNI